VNVALEQDFSVEVTIRTRVRRQLVAQFEPQMRTFAEWQRAHLEATGTLPVLHLGQPAPSTPVERNVFRRDGTHWTLTYDGKSVHVKDGNGMRLIAHLLRHPRREFHVLELVSILDGGPAYPHESHGNLSAEALDELGLHVVDGSHGEPPLDARAKADYERRVAALRENLDETRELGDAERAAAIELEIDFIQKELSAAFGLGGRARPARTPAERARTRIRKLIEGARRQIADHHPGLGHHLRAIKTGAYCSYSPAPSNELDWLT